MGPQRAPISPPAILQPTDGRKVGNFGTALQARTGNGSLLLTSGAGLVAEGRRGVKGVSPSVGRTGLPRRESGRLQEKEMKAVPVRFSAPKKAKARTARSGACGREAHRRPGREPERARPAGSAPGPGHGGRRLRCAQRARPGRLGSGNPRTLRGERAPSLGHPRRAAELRASPAVGAASRLRPEGHRLPTPGARHHVLSGLPGILQTPAFTLAPRPTPLPPPRTRAGQRGSTEPVES